MKVLLTGAAGFVGSHLVDALVARDHEVIGVDNLATGWPDNLRSVGAGGFALHKLDVTGSDASSLIRRAAPEVLVHLAAQPHVKVSMRDPVFDARNNIIGLVNVVDAARRAGCRKVVFATSGGTIYGGQAPALLPLREDLRADPCSFYGLSKKVGVEYLRLFAEQSGPEYAALALANVYGPRQDPHGEAGVVAIFAHQLLAGRRCRINGDGNQTRDYVYVGDVVDAFVRALTKGAGLINIGTGVETSVREVHDVLAGLVGSARPPEFLPELPGEVRRISLSPEKAGVELGWQPRVQLADGGRALVEWLRSRRTGPLPSRAQARPVAIQRPPVLP